MAGNSVTGGKGEIRQKNATLSRFHSDQKRTGFPVLSPFVNNVAPICQRLGSGPIPNHSGPSPFSFNGSPAGLAAASPPQGFNEPHFHGGGDTSSFRRREATKKWSGLCQPRRPCRQLRQTSRISLLESAGNSRTSCARYEVGA